MESLLQDLRSGIGTLLKNPGFTAVAGNCVAHGSDAPGMLRSRAPRVDPMIALRYE